MTTSVYLNGKIIDASEARISVSDAGWLHGAGLFETMRAENGVVFQLESHIERLSASAEKLLSPIERSDLPSQQDFQDLLAANSLKVARVRLTVSSGEVDTATENSEPVITVCVTAVPLRTPSSSDYERGVATAISAHRISPSDPLAGHKTTGYLPRLIALREAQRLRCTEAIWFTTNNTLAEGCISNVWIVQNSTLKTPPVNTPVLPGIARSIVLKLAAAAGLETSECTISIDDLLDADEVFLTNSIVQVLPVNRIEKHDIQEGRVGKIAKQLLEAYRVKVKKECSQGGQEESKN